MRLLLRVDGHHLLDRVALGGGPALAGRVLPAGHGLGLGLGLGLGRGLRAEGDARDLRDPLELAHPAARLAAQEAELERARLAAVAPASHLGVLLLLLPLVQPLELRLEHGVLLVELAQRHLQRGRLAELHLHCTLLSYLTRSA